MINQPLGARRFEAKARNQCGPWLTLFLCCFPLPGFILNTTALVLARRDLRAMASGQMGATGQPNIKNAAVPAGWALLIGAGVAIWLVYQMLTSRLAM